MILDNISPTNDVSVVSVQQVRAKLGLKNPTILNNFLAKTLKYVAFHDDLEDSYTHDVHKKNTLYEGRHRLMMPLDTAWRLIRDAEAGKILVRAARV